jgi:cardiolipin synthase
MKNEKKEKISNKIFTAPNLVSFARIIIVVFAGFELAAGKNITAFVLYGTAAVTDFLDGYLARSLRQVSELGKVLDPVADKLMINSAIIILLVQNRTPLWFAAIIVGRDLFNLFGALWVRSKTKFVLPSNYFGKIAAVLIMITFCLNIIGFAHIIYFYYISALLALIATFTYVLDAKKEIAKLFE